MPKKTGKTRATRSSVKRTDPGAAMTPVELLKAKGLMATSGVFNAAGVIEAYQKNLCGQDLGVDPVLVALSDRVNGITGGDLQALESMLFSQATALQTIFASLARRASGQQQLQQYQTFLSLALKAQAQSRATLEALIELKQPRHQPTFVRQANITSGPQQINNGASPTTADRAGAEKSVAVPNELLEAVNGHGLDTRTPGQAGRADPHLEAVGEVNRATLR